LSGAEVACRFPRSFDYSAAAAIHPKRRDKRDVAARKVCAGPPVNSLSKLPLGPINARTRQILPV
jgi:hypothetical protein